MISIAEYIWLDGARPTQGMRSKSRMLSFEDGYIPQISDFPVWGFDGSSTEQAEGSDSDCLLQPVNFVSDPIRGAGNYLVICEVLNKDGSPHVTNQRAKLVEALKAGGESHKAWFGFEQEYTLFQESKPLSWPENGFPAPQGPYYCGVGADRIFGRALVEEHMACCIEAGLMIYGVNAEVMPSQWEFQIGYRGVSGEVADSLTTSDHLWIGRWLLNRLGEEFGIRVSYEPKPVKGDWNGAGMHTNFSTEKMRAADTGQLTIDEAIKSLEKRHSVHIESYGDGLSERLTGEHETCHISEFRSGLSDRGASIRIPPSVAENGYGYIEDRRPAANADPYVVSRLLIETVCGVGALSEVKLKKAV